MAPKLVTDGFDQLTSVALNHIGMSPEFITDFARWETLKDTFDFTTVDKDEARNLVNTIGQSASKRAFEEVGKVVDKSMTVLAGVLGATGQWYGTAAALAGEEVLDWAEARFENYMGWNEDEPEAMRGDWAILDLGRRRVLGEETFEDVSPAEQDLAELHGRRLPSGLSGKAEHNMHIVLVTKHEAGDGTSKIYDQKTGARDIVNAHALVRMKDDAQARFNADEGESALRASVLAGRGEASLRSQLDSQVRRDWGKDVNYDGTHYTVSQETRAESHVFLEDDFGKTIEVEWNDPRLQPVWELSNSRPFSGFNPRAGFVQPAPGINSGDYCWLLGAGAQPSTDALVCVQFVKGSQVRVWLTTTGEHRDVDSDFLEYDEAPRQTQMWTNWVAAVQEAAPGHKNQRLKEWLPSTVVGISACERSSRERTRSSLKQSPFELGLGKVRKGSPESPMLVGDLPTPLLAKKLDENRERFEKMDRPFPMEWDVKSWSDIPPEREPDRTPAFDVLPILLGGALVAFVATR